MSDVITWETCPRCGRVAAVGWSSIRGDHDGEIMRLPVEFDCPDGCALDADEIVKVFQR